MFQTMMLFADFLGVSKIFWQRKKMYLIGSCIITVKVGLFLLLVVKVLVLTWGVIFYITISLEKTMDEEYYKKAFKVTAK